MIDTGKHIISLVVLFLCMVGVSHAQSAFGAIDLLRAGRSIETSVEVDETGFGYRSFEIRTDDDVFAVRLSLEGAPADLDLYIRYSKPIDSYAESDASGTSWIYNESLFLSRLSPVPLKSGTYYVDVVYQGGQTPMEGFRRLEEVPFKISLETINSGAVTQIRTGVPVSGLLKPDEGMAKTFSVRIPEGTNRCRVDIFDANADLDLLVSYKNPFPTRKSADYIAETLIGNESVILDGSEDEPELPGGEYYITVFDTGGGEFSQQFGLQVSLQSNPPRELLSIPRFPRSDDELQQALYSTVEVVGELGRGAGCIVSPDGLVLTSWHVVQGFSGGPSEKIVVSAAFSSRRPPQELFQARVLRYDRELDLALLEIESGLYGQRIPYDYEFPVFALGDSGELQIGQPLSMIGYPGAGEAGSRVAVSLSRGFVSGFEELGGIGYVKTDGNVRSGSSGGAVINAYFELLGIVAFRSGSGGNGFGYIFPVSEIPGEWIDMIRRRL